MKTAEKTLATKLRREGKSYNEILQSTKVSKGTLSAWLRDVPLTKEQIEEKFSKRQKNIALIAQRKRITKIKIVKETKSHASKEVKNIYPDPLFITGTMLYWAEGDKSIDTEAVKFTNSDPKMIELMMHWLRTICLVPENKFRVALHIHSLHIKKDIIQYWSKITKIPVTQFHKTQIKKTALSFRRKPLYQGTCSIRVYDRQLFRKIMGWKNGLLEIFSKMYYTV